MKKNNNLYIDDFVGITNRLEALPLAFAIQKKYGHRIILDWPELKDALSIDGTERGKTWLKARWNSKRLRDCSLEDFMSLEGKNVICRSLEGPDEYLSPIYAEVAKKVKIKTKIAKAIEDTFEPYSERPVVGVHIRQGDFQVMDENLYDPLAWEYPAVPLWWYAGVMEAIADKYPNVHFFLSCTGDPETYKELFERFNVFTLNQKNTYKKHEGNNSTFHPVTDLFALACCSTVLATPISGYSHWACNALGPKAEVYLPRGGATKLDLKIGKVDLYHQRLTKWRDAIRKDLWIKPVDNLISPTAPDISWIKGITVD